MAKFEASPNSGYILATPLKTHFMSTQNPYNENNDKCLVREPPKSAGSETHCTINELALENYTCNL